MRIQRAGGRVFAALLPALVLSAGLAHPATFSAQVLPSWQSGEFGSGAQTDIVFVPVVLGLDTSRQSLRLTIPWLRLSSDEPVIFSSGEVIGPPDATGGAGSTTESGLGDVVLKEEVFFLNGGAGRRPWLSGIVRVKFPTADETRGLGTGEMDYGAGVGLTQPLTSRWSLMAEAGHLWRGEPEGIDVQDTPWLFAGIQCRAAPSTSIHVAYDAQASLLPGRDDIRALVAGVDHRVSDAVTFKPGISYGLSDTAEDFGFTVGVSFRSGTPD